MTTTLTRWDPFAELGDLRTRFDRVFGELANGNERTWIPSIDVIREGESLGLHADIPGMKPEDVKIEIEDDVLTVSGEHDDRKDDRTKQFVRRERRYGSFTRSIALPSGIDAKTIKAKTHDGVLEVTIPLPSETKKETVAITPTAG